jgi:hypothetical protein
MLILFATPAVPVALKVTGLPVRPVEAAVMVLVPTRLPSVQLVSEAIPVLLVLMVAGLDGLELPPPAVMVKTTATPCTGLPKASVILTEGGELTGVPTVAL